MNKNTPLREVIDYLLDQKRRNEGIELTDEGEHEQLVIGLILKFAVGLLPSDKQLISDAYDKGLQPAYDCVQPQGPCDFDSKKHIEDKQEYLNQFNHE